MLDYKVISLYNKSNQFSVDIYQKTKTEFKVRTKIGFTSFSDDYCHGMYELARTCFFYVLNGYEMVTNNLGYEFAYSVHSGNFTEYEPPFKEPAKESAEEPLIIQPRGSEFRTGYEISLPIEDPSLLIRTENIILDPEVELPWKLAD